MSDVAKKKLKDQLTCAICLDQYEDPRSLSCLHSFCTECLKQLSCGEEEDGDNENSSTLSDDADDDHHKGAETLVCPTCRSTTKISQGKATNLPIAFHINNLLEIQELLKKSSDSNAVCSNQSNNCSKERAQYYCPQCDQFLCSSCNGFHSGWSSFSSHKVMRVEEVVSKTSNMVSVKPTPPMECSKHAKPLEVYCTECDHPICYLCTIKDHKGHEHTLVSDVYEECKQKINKRMELLEGKVQQRAREKNKLEESKKKAQENAEYYKMTINEMCDDFIQKINKVRHHGLQAVEMGKISYIACKEQQVKDEKIAIQALNDCKKYAECSLENSTPTQLLLMKKQIMERFTKLAVPEPSDVIVQDNVGNKYINLFLFGQEPCRRCSQLRLSDESSIKDLTKDILLFVPLQYPQLAYHQCELEADFPDGCSKEGTLCMATFSLLFEGNPIIVDKEKISCYLEENRRLSLYRSRRRMNCQSSLRSQARNLESNSKFRIECSVNYHNDDYTKYQVQFTPQDSGYYSLHVNIGSTAVSTTIPLYVSREGVVRQQPPGLRKLQRMWRPPQSQ